ncbi:MAG: histidine kinase N-terminal 7TM domain-containing protein [Patescibacteria group bacterium]
MTLHGYFLIAIGLVEVFLGFWLVYRYQRTAVNSWYIAFVFSVGLWVLANAGIYFYVDALETAQLFNELTWLAGVLIAFTFLFFSFYFPISLKPVRRYYYLLIFVPLVLFIYLIFFSKLFITGMIFEGNNQKFFTGSLFFLFPVYFLVYLIWGIINLGRKLKRTDGVHVRQLKLFLTGILISSVFIIVFDMIYPLFGKAVPLGLGPEFSIVWLGYTTYIILKR